MGFWIRTIPSVLEEDKNTGWKTYMLLKKASSFLENLSCHFAILSEGKTPHRIHQHAEEELFIIFSGTFEILTTESYPPQRKKKGRLKRGSVIYLPAHCPHTIKSLGPGPTSYLAFRWKGIINKSDGDTPKSFVFNQSERNRLPILKLASGLSIVHLFEMQTRYLRNFCANIHDLKINAGVKPHTHSYDLAEVLMNGCINTMQVEISAPAVLFFPAGTPHWTKNVGQTATTSFVFEFHGDKDTSLAL